MEIRAYQLSRKLGKALEERAYKLAVAESCTGGGLARAITMVPGSSAWFERGFVTYSNESKTELLGVMPAMIASYGAVSREVAFAMAQGALRRSHAELALSITGIAGPGGGTAEKPVGTVWFGLASDDEHCESCVKHFTGGRKHIRNSAVEFALMWLLETLASP